MKKNFGTESVSLCGFGTDIHRRKQTRRTAHKSPRRPTNEQTNERTNERTRVHACTLKDGPSARLQDPAKVSHSLQPDNWPSFKGFDARLRDTATSAIWPAAEVVLIPLGWWNDKNESRGAPGCVDARARVRACACVRVCVSGGVDWW